MEVLAGELGVRDQVHFTGFVPDSELPAAYAAMDLFCALGTAELQSLSTMEAMASGLPVVAADAHALPHLVGTGENGALVRPGDLGGLGEAVTRILGHPGNRARMGQASRRLMAGHDMHRMLAAFEDVYGLALVGRRVRPRQDRDHAGTR